MFSILKEFPYSIPHLKAHLEMAASHFMMCADGNLFYGTNLARAVSKDKGSKKKEWDYKDAREQQREQHFALTKKPTLNLPNSSNTVF